MNCRNLTREIIVQMQKRWQMFELCEPPVPPPKPRVASFEDEEKSRLLAQLLKSSSPEDLQAANRLIKSMVKVVSALLCFEQ